MLCWFLLCNEMIQLYVSVYPLPLEALSTPSSSHLPRSSQNTKLSCLCYTAGSHELFISHISSDQLLIRVRLFATP